MGSESEPAKLLLPFLQRADELQKHEPLVAYYCKFPRFKTLTLTLECSFFSDFPKLLIYDRFEGRLYAMERGLKIPQKDRTKTTNSLLISLINQLEKDKKSIKSGPDDYLYVEGFASNVFAKADKQDRAGRADLNTAKTFYAASIFFEILSQFGELQPDIEQKLKYAVWKAADIRKALKEGRKPELGPPGGDKDLSVPSSPPSSTYHVGHENFSSTHPTAGAPTHHEEKDMRRSESFQASSPGADLSSEPLDRTNSYSASQPPASSPSTYPTDCPPGDNHQRPPSNTQDIPGYPQNPHPQSYPDNQHFLSPKTHPENLQNYHPEMPPPPYSYPNFQSYPNFHETTFPAAPTHQPSYYHGPDYSSYSNQSSANPSNSNYASPTVKYDYGSGNGNHFATPSPPTTAASTAASASPPAYTYDSNYLPPVEKIAEAHKAARFAVGALAFDDVPVAVEFLRKSLELLTNPKAETH